MRNDSTNTCTIYTVARLVKNSFLKFLSKSFPAIIFCNSVFGNNSNTSLGLFNKQSASVAYEREIILLKLKHLYCNYLADCVQLGIVKTLFECSRAMTGFPSNKATYAIRKITFLNNSFFLSSICFNFESNKYELRRHISAVSNVKSIYF